MCYTSSERCYHRVTANCIHPVELVPGEIIAHETARRCRFYARRNWRRRGSVFLLAVVSGTVLQRKSLTGLPCNCLAGANAGTKRERRAWGSPLVFHAVTLASLGAADCLRDLPRRRGDGGATAGL